MSNRLYRIVIVLCWAAAIGLVLTNLRLSNSQRDMVRRLDLEIRSRSLSEGALAQPLKGLDRDGVPMAIDSREADGPVLVIVFSSDCPYTANNWPQWDVLVREHAERGGQVVPVDLTGAAPADYITAHGLDGMPVLSHVPVQNVVQYRLGVTPQTLVIDSGVVVGLWSGVLTEDDLARASDLLDGVDGTVGAGK